MKFTIRDLLWLTVVVALGIGWWVDRQRTAKWNQEVHTELAAQLEAMKREKHDWQANAKSLAYYMKGRGFDVEFKTGEGGRSVRVTPVKALTKPSAPALNPPGD
ncbi:MAG TPA: hypothetical protein VFB96_19065 [Pirellulaceae bacterium]|nr:hypothetical protein [Pirellulaceae bacterium]